MVVEAVIVVVVMVVVVVVAMPAVEAWPGVRGRALDTTAGNVLTGGVGIGRK